LKFGSENELNDHNYHSIFVCEFLLIVRSGKSHATISLIGCARGALRVLVSGNEECENY